MKRTLLIILLVLWASTAWTAQLVLISDKTKRDVNEIGDVVAILPDSHQFSPTELQMFKILQVKGTVEEVRKALEETVDPKFEQRAKYRYRAAVEDSKTVTISIKDTIITTTVSK